MSWKGSSKPMSNSRGYLEWRDVERLIDATSNKRDRVLFKTLAYTGRRVSEIVRGPLNKPEKQYGIRPCDIEKDSNIIHFNILKKPVIKREPVTVWPEIKKILVNYTTNLHDNEWIFPLTRQRVEQLVKKYGRKIGITHVGDGDRNKLHPHHFRHSFAIHMARNLKNPADLRKLQMILKHSSITITEHYLKFAETDTDIYGQAFG